VGAPIAENRAKRGGLHETFRRFQAGRVGMSGAAFRHWRIDPGWGWFVRRSGRLVDEALRVVAECLIECDLTRGVSSIGLAVVNLVRSHQSDATVVVVLIVPIEEVSAETSSVLDAAEAGD
jgi:hypothetical protein